MVNPCSFNWQCMERTQKRAAKAIGHTRVSWDLGIDVPLVEDKYWKELTEEEQEHAKLIGFTQQSWDHPPAYCREWVQMTDDEKDAASLLGFGRNSWNYSCTGSEDYLTQAYYDD